MKFSFSEIWHELDSKFVIFKAAFCFALIWYMFLFNLNPKSLDDLKIAHGIIMDVGSDDERRYLEVFTNDRRTINIFLNGDTRIT